jgi:hypothetical protein
VQRARRRTTSRIALIALVPAALVPLLALAGLSASLAAEQALCGSAGTAAASEPATGGSATTTSGVPEHFLADFMGAAAAYDLGADGWAYLAAINRVESDFDDAALPGVASGANAAGAAGPMQIGIGGAAGATWQRYEVTGVPGGADPPSVYDEADAVYAAANLLHASGAPGDWPEALYAYNHAGWYVAEVSAYAARYGVSQTGLSAAACASTDDLGPTVAGNTSRVLASGQAAIPRGAPKIVQAMLRAGNRIDTQIYSYGGGHIPAAMGIPPDPASDPGEEENGGPGYDCSSAVDYVLWGGGLGGSLLEGGVPASTGLAAVGEPGPGRWVTIYAGSSGGEGHAFIEVDGVVLDTVHLEPTSPPGSGPRWQPLGEVARELASGSFVARHPPGL